MLDTHLAGAMPPVWPVRRVRNPVSVFSGEAGYRIQWSISAIS